MQAAGAKADMRSADGRMAAEPTLGKSSDPPPRLPRTLLHQPHWIADQDDEVPFLLLRRSLPLQGDALALQGEVRPEARTPDLSR